MSSDLISRESVLKLIEDIKMNPEIPKNYGTLLDIMREIREIPTAYDLDKVVERLRENSMPFMGDKMALLDIEMVRIEEIKGE